MEQFAKTARILPKLSICIVELYAQNACMWILHIFNKDVPINCHFLNHIISL